MIQRNAVQYYFTGIIKTWSEIMLFYYFHGVISLILLKNTKEIFQTYRKKLYVQIYTPYTYKIKYKINKKITKYRNIIKIMS